MYLNFLYNKKKFFLILKKYFHKNFYNKKFFFSFLKRIFSIKIFFKNNFCKKIKNFSNKILIYYFMNIKKILFKNCIKIFYIYSFNIYLKFFLYNSYIKINLFIFYLELTSSYSKIIININNLKKKYSYLIKFNNLYIIIKKNIILNNWFFFFYKNFFFLEFKKNVYNFFVKIINLIFVYEKKNFLIELYNLKLKKTFFQIYSLIKIKNKINFNFIYQKAIFELYLKNILVINFNIILQTKKIFCKHKISFFFKNKLFFIFLNNKILKKI